MEYKTFQKKIDQFHIRVRKYRYKRTKGRVKGIAIHNAFHYLLLPCIKLLRVLRKQNLILVSDKHIQYRKKSIIYACTHIGGNDVECLFEAIKSPCFLFLGDPREVYMNLDGLMLYLNGVICLDSYDKEDRYIAKQTAISLLKQGGSLMIYPEGAWNISENQPVMGLFTGTAEIAIMAKAEIVPVAIERYENDYYVSIGGNICCADYMIEKKVYLTELLRNELASLKLEIWESIGVSARTTISDKYKEVFLNEIFDEKDTSYTLKDVTDTMYKDKKVTSPKEAFAYLLDLKPNRQNAFLMKSVGEYKKWNEV